MVKLSIIIPCYNEGKKLIENLLVVEKYMQNYVADISYEIIAVNDGSTDYESNHIFATWKCSNPNIKLIGYKENKGKGNAVKYGVVNSSGEWILFMDADLSTGLDAISRVSEEIKKEKYSFIIGSRRNPASLLIKPQGFIRRFIGTGCVIVTNIITGLKIKDTQCGFKAVERELVEYIVNRQTINKWAFDVEWLYIAHINGYEIKEIPVIWENDSDSKVSPISSSINFFADLLHIRKNRKYYKKKQVP